MFQIKMSVLQTIDHKNGLYRGAVGLVGQGYRDIKQKKELLL